ncbi:MAG: molybdopterin-binding protein [Alphaproteobacteria bacterium]
MNGSVPPAESKSATVTAAMVIIGNEILSGRTADKNLNYLATKLTKAGVRLMEVRVVPDLEEMIVEAVNALRTRHDYVFTTGGIGPTHDDITAGAIARAFGVRLIRHPEAEALLRAHYSEDRLNEARLSMADTPEGADLVTNPVSAAPGFRMENVFVMAGVPTVMQAMTDEVVPRLRAGAPVLSQTVAADLGEGTVAAGLADIQTAYPALDIGSYPYFRDGKFGTSLVVRGTERAAIARAAAEIAALVTDLGAAPQIGEIE